MVLYGPRDAVCILMDRGHRVALRRFRASGTRRWVLDNRVVSLAELEDLAESYERLRYRHTLRRPARGVDRLRSAVWLRAFTGRDGVKVGDQRKRAVVNRGFCGLLRSAFELDLEGG